MDKEKELALIEAYINGELSSEETLGFENRLTADGPLKELLDVYVILKEGIQTAGKKALLHKFETWDQGMSNPLVQAKTTSPKSINLGVWRAAAAVLVIGTLGFFLWYSSGVQKSKRLYNEYFEVYSNVMVPITRSNQDLTQTEEAFLSYESGDYESAIEGFTKLLETEERSFLYFYRAMGLMSIKQYQGAIKDLETVISLKDEFAVQSNWYKALCYLAEGDTASASIVLNSISSGKSSYKEKSVELINQLEYR